MPFRRHDEVKRRAPAVVRGGPQPPAVGGDDRSADGEPHAHALGLGRIEGLEELVEGLRGETDAGIPDRHAHALGVPAGGDDHVARAVVHSARGVDGVDDEVEDHLLRLDSIAGDAGRSSASWLSSVTRADRASLRTRAMTSRTVSLATATPSTTSVDRLASPYRAGAAGRGEGGVRSGIFRARAEPRVPKT